MSLDLEKLARMLAEHWEGGIPNTEPNREGWRRCARAVALRVIEEAEKAIGAASCTCILRIRALADSLQSPKGEPRE